MAESFKDSLPTDLVNHITALCGQKGEEWFDRLPYLVAELEKKWACKMIEPFPGIEYNFVASAVRESGDAVVLKIAPPFDRPEILAEAKYLRTRNGNTAVRLLAEDHERQAILIERAIPGEALFKRFEDDPLQCVEPAIGVLRSILRPALVDRSDVDTLDRWFKNFERFRETDFPQERSLNAVEIYERLSQQPNRTFYLHGDFHPGNIVTSTREPFLAIDPKGIIGHLGYDIAVFLNNLHWWRRNDSGVGELLDAAIRKFAADLEFTEKELREWAFAYMVIGAWWNFEDLPEHYDDEVAMSDVWGI